MSPTGRGTEGFPTTTIDLSDFQAGDIVEYRIGAAYEHDGGAFLHWKTTAEGHWDHSLSLLEQGG